MAIRQRAPFAILWSPEDSPRSRRARGTREPHLDVSRRISRGAPGRQRAATAARGEHLRPKGTCPARSATRAALGRRVQPVLSRALRSCTDFSDHGRSTGQRTGRRWPDVPVARSRSCRAGAERRDAPGVEAGRHHHRADGLGQPGHGALEALGDLVRVGARADDVVPPARRRPGSRASSTAFGSWSATIWSSSFRARQRLVYWKSPSGRRSASSTANRSAQPTNAPSGAGSCRRPR